MNHSPGPFRAEGGAIKAITHGRWYTVARVDRGKFTPEGREANAAFLAHAGTCHDELLEALRDTLTLLHTLGYVDGDVVDSARVAIEKAEGGS